MNKRRTLLNAVWVSPVISSVVLPVHAQTSKGQSTFIDQIEIDPTNPTDSDIITVSIYGNHSTPGFMLGNPSTSTSVSGLDIQIDFRVISPNEPQTTVLTPFSYSVIIGPLDFGIYSLEASVFVDGFLDDTIRTNLEVS